MYKILHKLFGWDYVHWQNGRDANIVRLRVDGCNQPYYLQYRKYVVKITEPNQVTWLTCKPEKYLESLVFSSGTNKI